MSKQQIFEKAKEIANLIAMSDEKKNALEASRHLMEDEEASTLIGGYNKCREAKIAEFDGKQPTKEEIEEFNNYLQEEFNKIMENAIISEYVKASREFDMMLTDMDNIIKQGISGGEGGGCSGSCSTCSGCH